MAYNDDEEPWEEETWDVFKELIIRCRGLAGIKESRQIDALDPKSELENLVSLENARGPLLEYATHPLYIEILKDHETPWTDNFGETDRIDLPVIKVKRKGRSYYATETGFVRARVIKYLLKNLKGIDPESERILQKNRGTISEYNRLYKEMVGY